MKSRLLFSVLVCACLTLGMAAAQQSAAPAVVTASSAVPSLINYTGVLKDSSGRMLSSVTGVTFLLYKEEQGGAPLWLETQNVTPDKTGHYSVQLGRTSAKGLPADLFVSGQGRWLAVQIGSEAEQPRALLVAVPYAMKAVDAETVGGLPASAFVLAAPPSSGSASTASGSAAASGSSSSLAPLTVTTTGGVVNTLPLWTTGTNIQSSVITQSGTKIGINTTTPGATLDVKGGETLRGLFYLTTSGTATASGGKNSYPFDIVASSFNSTTSAALNQTFQWIAEPAGNNTSNPSGTLNLLYGLGPTPPSETGLKISNAGVFTFAPGQPFPGAGTVSSVASGAGLTGGPVTTSGTLSIATGGVTNAMLANPSLTVAAGTDLTGGGSVALGGTTTLNLDTTRVPLLTGGNLFTGTQTITGNLSVSGTVGVGTNAPTQKFQVNYGNFMAKGTNNFKANGDTAFVYVGDTNHSIEALYNSGLAIGAYKVPQAIFIQDQSGSVGIGTTNLAGTLTAVSNGFQSGAAAVFADTTAGIGSASAAGTLVSTSNAFGTAAGVFFNNAGGTILDVRGRGTIFAVNSEDEGSVLDINAGGASPETWGILVNGATGDSTQAPPVAIAGAGGDQGESGSPIIGKDTPTYGMAGTGGIFGGGIVWQGIGPGGTGAIFLGGDNYNVGPGGVGATFTGGIGVGAPFGDGMDSTASGQTYATSLAYAGNFAGDLNVSGAVFAGTKDFKIDHPLDPANKYLFHASVESSEMTNIYSGNIATDGQGHATVQLPEWFEALNADFRYQLTVIGQFAQAIVAHEIQNNRFDIMTSAPNVKVSWQVTGVRRDAYAKANPLVVEQEKEARVRGYYIHPELYNAPPEKQIEWARNPEWMRSVKELRAKRRRDRTMLPARSLRGGSHLNLNPVRVTGSN